MKKQDLELVGGFEEASDGGAQQQSNLNPTSPLITLEAIGYHSSEETSALE